MTREVASGSPVTATRCPGVRLFARGLNGMLYSTKAVSTPKDTSHRCSPGRSTTATLAVRDSCFGSSTTHSRTHRPVVSER
jgi:hypothetical protein